jgi:hypothetical protein
MRVVRRTGMFIVAGLALAVAAGCGEQQGGAGTAASTAPAGSSTATPSESPSGGSTLSTAATTPAGPERCHTADLAAALGRPDAGAGNRYAVLTLTNTSDRPCVVFGYGGVQLLDAAGKQVPTRQVRDPRQKPQRVLLAPRAVAESTLHWGVVPAGNESTTGDCQPTAATLLVTPPDETEPLRIPWSFGPVCQQGRIDQGGYVAAK